MADTGTVKGIKVWLGQQRAAAGAVVELHACPIDGRVLVSSWELAEIKGDVDAWAPLVDELATSDARSRGEPTMSYDLIMRVDDATRGTMRLRREGIEPGGQRQPTGSMQDIVAQLQKSTERAHAQVIESARVATQTAQAAYAGQAAALTALSQAHALIGSLMTTNVSLHADRIDATDAAAAAATSKNPKDDMFRTMMELAMPTIVERLGEHLMSPKATTTKTDDKEN